MIVNSLEWLNSLIKEDKKTKLIASKFGLVKKSLRVTLRSFLILIKNVVQKM